MKLKVTLWFANVFGALSRLTGRGSGVMVTGRIILKLMPSAVATLSKNRRIVLITGTNGKTTTTSLICNALSTTTRTISNFTGANLFAGVATALGQDTKATTAALEVDEMVLPWAITQTRPELVVLLNLGRDQLDRLSEVRSVAQKWKVALLGLPANCQILADADDPFVVWAAQDWSRVIWFSAGTAGHMDASTCPVCGHVLGWSDGGNSYHCECGFKKPNPEWVLKDDTLRGPHGEMIEVVSRIPGRAALSNAARAIISASVMGVPSATAANAVSMVSSVDGRFGELHIGTTTFRLLLSKNPASWRETLATSSTSGPETVLLAVNANTQDGKDTSWLWDVDYSPLRGRVVLVTGERGIDVSARLTVNEIPHRLVNDELEAARVIGDRKADLIASYTAFHRLSKSVRRR
ncbi:MAG TPA: MurT ligase domain-containing protein [Candidatus Paceibacterota bacterium]|nr:MurT ligase domain-containing protein [Candidatus Paceibacterota bacterium]